MFKKTVTKTMAGLIASLSLISAADAQKMEAWDFFDMMIEELRGEWVLSSAERQTGTLSYRHEAVLPLVGTNATGIAFKLIGAETTIQEDLLPNTAKQMVTMYHCKDIACTTLKATHYCVKQNQPEFIADLEKSTPKRIIFNCDMSTELCQSNEDHVHQIIHELSNNGKHLKSSYLSWENGRPKENSSIYHFDKR